MAREINSGILGVYLWGMEIGKLCWDQKKRNTYFFFSKEYFNSGLDIAPLIAPANEAATKFAIFGNTEQAKYQKLPPFIADSLPDDWGNALFDQWFSDNHFHEKDKTPLAKLAFIGKRAMGALEFQPCSEDGFNQNEKLLIPELYTLAKEIEQRRGNAVISTEDSLTKKSLIAIGTSAGGRFKKAIISMDADGNIYSGQTSAEQHRKYFIIKFNAPEFCASEREMTWYDLATRAGITMMPSKLIEIEGVRHFITERYDRQNGEKLHTQSLAALNPEAYCYEDLFETSRRLSIPMDEQNELFLRLVFNVLSGNTDDHAKNFSFVMGRNGIWHISPAYDENMILKEGLCAEKEHRFSVKGKYEDITLDDLKEFAKENNIKNPDKYIQQVRAALKDFPSVALDNGVAPGFIHIMAERLIELNPGLFQMPVDPMSKQVWIRPTDSGNLHLYAIVGGKIKRRVFTQKNKNFGKVLQLMYEDLDEEKMSEIVREFFT